MKNKYKVSRGIFEQEKKKQANRTSNIKVALIVLPIIMVAVLIIGVYFSYLSYQNNLEEEGEKGAVITKEINDISNDYLFRVVNTNKPLDKDFVPELVEYNGVKISPVLKDSLDKLMKDSKEDGMSLKIRFAYVSFEEQQEDFEKAIKNYKDKNNASAVKAESEVLKNVSKGGESEYQLGLSVYFESEEDGPFNSTKEYYWLQKNAVKYGFIERYTENDNVGGIQSNTHVYRYVGEENAIKMRSLNMNFDQYVNYLSKQ